MGKFDPKSYLNDFDAESYLAETPKGDIGDAIIEPAKAIAGNIGTEIEAGYSGLAASALEAGKQIFTGEGDIPAAGVQAIEDVRSEAPDYSPQTEMGKKGLETVQDLVNAGIDVANFSLSGLEGLSHLIKSSVLGDPEGGLDKAVSTIKDIQQSGITQSLGNRAFEGTGSPAIATAAEMSPDIAGLLTGGGAARAGIKAIPETAETIGRGLQAGAKPVIQAGKELVEGASNFQTPAQRKMAIDIQKGSNDPALAGFEAVQAKPQLDAEGNEIPAAPETRLSKYFDPKAPKLKKSPVAQKALDQGWDAGVIQPITNASTADKALMSQMTKMAETITKDKLYGMKNRPSDVAGDKLMSWLDVVRESNRAAGKDIKPQAEKLKGQSIDVTEVGSSFSNALDDLGVTLTRGKDGKITPNYEGSDIEGLPSIINQMNSVINRIDRVAGTGKIDAYAFHQLKSFIDTHVTFGKAGEGLSGKSARILKDLRFDVNKALGDKFPDYAKANKTYSETIKSLDAFQDVAGRKMNLIGPNADKATGTLMRRLMGNAQSRITLMDAIEDIKLTVDKHGGYGGPLKIEGIGGDVNNLDMLVMFADEVDRVIGTAPPTSIQGVFDRSIAPLVASPKAGAIDIGIDLLGRGADKLKGVNTENAIKTMQELLKNPQTKSK